MDTTLTPEQAFRASSCSSTPTGQSSRRRPLLTCLAISNLPRKDGRAIRQRGTTGFALSRRLPGSSRSGDIRQRWPSRASVVRRAETSDLRRPGINKPAGSNRFGARDVLATDGVCTRLRGARFPRCGDRRRTNATHGDIGQRQASAPNRDEELRRVRSPLHVRLETRWARFRLSRPCRPLEQPWAVVSFSPDQLVWLVVIRDARSRLRPAGTAAPPVHRVDGRVRSNRHAGRYVVATKF